MRKLGTEFGSPEDNGLQDLSSAASLIRMLADAEEERIEQRKLAMNGPTAKRLALVEEALAMLDRAEEM